MCFRRDDDGGGHRPIAPVGLSGWIGRALCGRIRIAVRLWSHGAPRVRPVLETLEG